MLDPFLVFLSKFAEQSKGKLLAWTLVVAIAIALINIFPQVYTEYLKAKPKNVISMDDTYRIVLQKLNFYNDPVINGLYREFGDSTIYDSRTVTLTTSNLLSTHLQTAFDEMNRLPFCMPSVGTWVSNQLMSDSFRTDIVAYISTETLTLDDRLRLVKKVMIEYERKVGDNLRSYMKEVKTCVK